MNADDPAAAVHAVAEDASIAAEAAWADPLPATSSVSALPERFQSAAEFEAWLLDAAVAQWGHLFGRSTYNPQWDWARVFTTDAVLLGAPGVPMVTTAVANSFSNTNVQVEGVDEADLVETDGQYLYILSGQDLVIVEAGLGEELRLVSRTRLTERPLGMYLSGDRLALVSSSHVSSVEPIQFMPMIAVTLFTDGPQLAETESAGPTTTVTVLDISDRSAPILVQKTQMDGQLVTSRVVDGQLRLVLSNYLQLPAPMAHPVATVLPQAEPVNRTDFVRSAEPVSFVISDSLWWPGEPRNEHVYETQEQYLTRVRDVLLGAVRPHTRSLALDGSVISETALFEPTDVYRPESDSHRSVITVATFDLASNEAGPVATANVMAGSAPQVFSTAENVYVFAQQTPEGSTWNSDSVYKSNVWKFGIDGETHAVALTATGEFEGTLLNQFAADERNGYLRLVTKPGGWNQSGHGVQVLAQSGHALTVVGSIGGIAPNEVLYSVRFLDQRAFFVTFRKVDPLFAVDLSEPANPRLLGELHIPGYSDYLQPIDENHLLAIGRGADESTGLFQELQVSIFDVSDLTDPRLLHRYSFAGGRATATPATGNRWERGDGEHHAVSYFGDQHVLALPIYTADAGGGSWGGVDNTPLFEVGQGGLQVFQVDLDDGFTPIGLVEHETLVERSLRIGEHLYAISSGTVSVHDLADPTQRLGEVSIAAEPDEQPLQLTMYQPPWNENTAAVTVDPVNQPVQTTLFWRQLVVPGEISTTILRWHDPNPNLSFSASLTWTDNTPAGLHLTQTFGPDGTDATLSYWRTPTTFGEFTGTLTVRHSGGFEQSYPVNITAVTVLLRPDQHDATKTELAIGGFELSDPILFQPDVGGKKMIAPNVVQTAAGEPSARLFYHGSDMGAFIADRIVVYGQGGNDLIQVNEAIKIDAWLFGQAGNDNLVGGGGDDILVGGLGDDILYGFDGRDLVFGGLGRDFVQGAGGTGSATGDDGDVVIGSYVSFDFDPVLLNQLSREWRASDAYATRINTIRQGSAALRPNVTVFDDFSPDLVFGATDLDWFFVEPTRDTFDAQPNETVN